MSKIIKISKQNISLNHLVDYFQINIVSLNLNVSVSIIVNCYDKNSSFLFSKTFLIEGDEYLGWGNDDSYLINLISQKLGVSILNE
jgi:hypothetical protein